ncbi:MAG: phytanoyl-CoA dioxygenase family protein [Candidatus Nanopelagicales bacterium]
MNASDAADPAPVAAVDRARDLVPPDLAAAYARDGAVVVRGAFTAAEVDLVRSGIDRVLAEPGPMFLVASEADDPGRFAEDFCRWQDVPEYEEFARTSPAAGIAGRLMGSTTVRLHHDHTLVKEPGTVQRTPWHQDQPYYDVEGRQNCSMWMPVDPVPRESSLEFVAGSHLGPWLMPRTFRDQQARWFPEGTLAELPDVEADRDAFPILGWALEPGDAVFFHMLALHAAAGSGTRRRAFSLRFLGDDATHAPRPWRTSPQFDGLAETLPAGAPFDDARFPLLIG